MTKTVGGESIMKWTRGGKVVMVERQRRGERSVGAAKVHRLWAGLTA